MERPILFSGPMVRAILEGRKTQTRRIVKLGPGGRDVVKVYGPSPRTGRMGAEVACDDGARSVWCHYGAPGDRLWVRETWAPMDFMDSGMSGLTREDPVWVGYRADQAAIAWEKGNVHQLNTDGWGWNVKWRSPLFMPRWASRISLEVTGVRVERLQDITEEDARAEGVDALDGEIDEVALCFRAKEMGETPTDSRVWFSVLWDAINGKRAPWASNPWVWVVSFRRAA